MHSVNKHSVNKHKVFMQLGCDWGEPMRAPQLTISFVTEVLVHVHVYVVRGEEVRNQCKISPREPEVAVIVSVDAICPYVRLSYRLVTTAWTQQTHVNKMWSQGGIGHKACGWQTHDLALQRSLPTHYLDTLGTLGGNDAGVMCMCQFFNNQ